MNQELGTSESGEGILIDQVVTMLQAVQAQGATHVKIACRTSEFSGVESDVDWVSMEPIGNVAYIGAIAPHGKWAPASDEALNSLDWGFGG